MTEQEKYILDNLRYDHSTGLITRIKRKNRWGEYPVNEIAGTENHGYLRVMVNGATVATHRIAFLFMQGSLPSAEMDVDHINGNRRDNRWSNLRIATRSQNNMNSDKPVNNTSGHKGVHRDKRTSKNGCRKHQWFARIKVATRIIHLGVFETCEQAVAARKVAEEKYFGQFARCG